jgi:hypothetical protein
MAENRIDQVVRARADCGPDAEFLSPLFDGVPDEPVETDCG